MEVEAKAYADFNCNHKDIPTCYTMHMIMTPESSAVKQESKVKVKKVDKVQTSELSNEELAELNRKKIQLLKESIINEVKNGVSQ